MILTRVITLLTDFGLRDPYVGVMKGVIKRINPDVEIIDLSHEVPKYDIDTAALILWVSYRFFPRKTIHVCVVDPGVGTSRKAILIVTKNYYFIGPDNGCLYPAAKSDGIEEIYDISDSAYGLDLVSLIKKNLLSLGSGLPKKMVTVLMHVRSILMGSEI